MIREWESDNGILRGSSGRHYKKRAIEKSKRVGRGKRREQNWFRYDDDQSVRSRFNMGCVLLGFYSHGAVHVVYGKKGADKVSFFPVDLVFGGSRQRECRLDYKEYKFDKNVCTELKDDFRSVNDREIE